MTSSAVGHRPQRGKIVAWSLWDWGSAAFNAVIITFVFSVYLVDAVGDDLPGTISASTWYGWAIGAGAFIVAVSAPALGQRSDASGRRKRTLGVLTLVVVALTAALFFVEDDYHYLWLGLLLVSLASIAFELSQVPYFAMLRQVSTPDTVGRVSGIGWAFGYLGGIVLLLICYFGFISGDGGLLGLSTENGFNIRLVALLSAGWFLLFAIPLFFSVPELPAEVSPDRADVGFVESYRVLFAELRTMWREDRDVLKFLIASAFYRDGLSGVFTFGGILAVSVYGIDAADVILFAVAANVVSAAGAWVAGYFDDSWGSRRVVIASLVSMLVVALVLLFVSGPTMFWIFGLALCLFVGPAQAASRTYLTRATRLGKEGQNFGLYAMTGRAVSFLAPTLFGLFVLIGDGDRWGIIGIMLVLAVGLAMLLRVPEVTGDRANDLLSGESHGDGVR